MVVVVYVQSPFSFSFSLQREHGMAWRGVA